MGNNEFGVTRYVLTDIDAAAQDKGETAADLADLGQRLVRAIGVTLAEATHALDLRWLQDGKHLVASRVEDRLLRRGCGHWRPAMDSNLRVHRPDITIRPADRLPV